MSLQPNRIHRPEILVISNFHAPPTALVYGAHILDLGMIGFVTSGLGQLSKTYNWHQRTIGITDNWPYDATEKNQNYYVYIFKTLHSE